MTTKFDDILLHTTDADYPSHIQRLRSEHSMDEFLKSRSKFADTVRQIVADVSKRGDAAVAEYTEKFDNVKLVPSEFRVPAKDLKAAHEQLEPALLESLKKSIANVRKYQSEIFIGNKTHIPAFATHR